MGWGLGDGIWFVWGGGGRRGPWLCDTSGENFGWTKKIDKNFFHWPRPTASQIIWRYLRSQNVSLKISLLINRQVIFLYHTNYSYSWQQITSLTFLLPRAIPPFLISISQFFSQILQASLKFHVAYRFRNDCILQRLTTKGPSFEMNL